MGIAYVAVAFVWLTFTMTDLMRVMLDGQVSLQATQGTAAKRIYTIVHLFWTYLCGAVLWPGSMILYVAAKIIVRYDEEDE
jgi:hypothetical protein